MNGASFYESIHSEYHSVLTKLIQYYKDNLNNNEDKELQLENFSPEQIDIPNVQLNLEPIFVQVKDINTCKSMIDLTLQLLSESIPPNSLHVDENQREFEELFAQVLYMLENYSIDMKIVSLKFFSNLITNYDQVALFKFFHSFPKTCKELLYCTEAFVKSINIFHEKGELDSVNLDRFNITILNIIKIYEINLERDYEDLLITICTVILGKHNKIFNKQLKLYCLSMSKTLEFPEDVINIQNMDSTEIEMVNKYYCKKILEHIESCKESKCLFNIKRSWHYNQIMCVLQSFIWFCKDETSDNFLLTYHLQQCSAALNILYNVYFNSNDPVIWKELSYFLLQKEETSDIYRYLTHLNKLQRNFLIQDITCTRALLRIVLITTILCHVYSKHEIMRVLELLTVLNQEKESSLEYNECVKTLVLKYLMVVKLIMGSDACGPWDRNIICLVNSLTRNKTVSMYKEVCIELMLPIYSIETNY